MVKLHTEIFRGASSTRNTVHYFPPIPRDDALRTELVRASYASRGMFRRNMHQVRHTDTRGVCSNPFPVWSAYSEERELRTVSNVRNEYSMAPNCHQLLRGGEGRSHALVNLREVENVMEWSLCLLRLDARSSHTRLLMASNNPWKWSNHQAPSPSSRLPGSNYSKEG